MLRLSTRNKEYTNTEHAAKDTGLGRFLCARLGHGGDKIQRGSDRDRIVRTNVILVREEIVVYVHEGKDSVWMCTRCLLDSDRYDQSRPKLCVFCMFCAEISGVLGREIGDPDGVVLEGL